MTPKVTKPAILEELGHRLLRAGGLALHVPICEAKILIESFDTQTKNQRLIQSYKGYGHSWTRNAYNQLFSTLAAVNGSDNTFEGGKLSIRGTNGTVEFGAQGLGLEPANMTTAGKGNIGLVGDVSQGIVVGSGVNAESFEDYVLQTIIANGAGAGQLNYIQSQATVVSYVVGTKTLTATLVRYMNNNSGGNVSVNEIALIATAWLAGGFERFIVMSRDHLGATITIPDTGQLKVTYAISLVYPA
jgi:hypothetical protein